MRRICKYCGAEFDGTPDSTACPGCAAREKQSVIRMRTCRQCGASFLGGPRAFYCPPCRAERKKAAAKRYRENGPQRMLGSTDRCTVCGKEYVVKAARQTYCPDCAAAAVREIDRAQSRAWNRENLLPSKRRAERKAAAAEIPCVVCGKLFAPHNASRTCSAACSQARARQRNKKACENYSRRKKMKQEETP